MKNYSKFKNAVEYGFTSLLIKIVEEELLLLMISE
jgi:hypothetical protein